MKNKLSLGLAFCLAVSALMSPDSIIAQSSQVIESKLLS